MPVEITERYFDPDDADDVLAQIAAGQHPAASQSTSPWVEPDYDNCPTWPPTKEQEEALLWPGPPMIMPAGLLPDGTTRPRDSIETARRICGREIRPAAEAEAYVNAYEKQQRALRERAGLPRPTRTAPHGKLEDTPETIEKIKQLHAEERARRHQDHYSAWP